jgi:hypothetical protein
MASINRIQLPKLNTTNFLCWPSITQIRDRENNNQFGEPGSRLLSDTQSTMVLLQFNDYIRLMQLPLWEKYSPKMFRIRTFTEAWLLCNLQWRYRTTQYSETPIFSDKGILQCNCPWRWILHIIDLLTEDTRWTQWFHVRANEQKGYILSAVNRMYWRLWALSVMTSIGYMCANCTDDTWYITLNTTCWYLQFNHRTCYSCFNKC